jgi:hypothetical protein
MRQPIQRSVRFGGHAPVPHIAIHYNSSDLQSIEQQGAGLETMNWKKSTVGEALFFESPGTRVQP